MVYAVGTKGRDSVEREGYTIAGDYSEAINEPLYADASEIGQRSFEQVYDGGDRRDLSDLYDL